ncbi:MAG: metal ABC transporter solute-binding protein, Zn/Mn family, partial [Rubrimonas sp.]
MTTMKRRGLSAILAAGTALAALGGASAWAAPAVVTDIAPVHSLAARVMQGVGEPALILPPGASPHGYALRPSEAARLAEADLIFWIGPALSPWFGEAAASLAPTAGQVVLRDAPGVVTLPIRTGATFDDHDHDHGHGHGHGHDHGHGHSHGHGHDHGHG